MTTPRCSQPSLDGDLPHWYSRTLDCVHCGLCLEACPTYGVLGTETDSPRGRIHLMRAMAEGRVTDVDAIRPHLDRCLDCRACETACPSGVRYGSILESVRSELRRKPTKTRTFRHRLAGFLLRNVVAKQGRLRWFFRFARASELLGLRRLARALRLLPNEVDALVPTVPKGEERRPLTGIFRPSGEPRGKVYLFTGCVMEQVFGGINRRTRDLLVHNGYEVHVPSTQACCGALLVHDGQAAEARRLALTNLEAFAGDWPIVTNSAGCGAMLHEYGDLLGEDVGAAFGARCIDVTALLARDGLRATPARCERKVAYDAPCHLCHAQKVRTAPLELLAQVPGLELAPNPGSEDCCGSAGIYNLLQPAIASEIGARKARELIATGATMVVTGNPGCMMQIAARLRALGHPLEVRHPVDLLLPADPCTVESAPKTQ
ncbi:MAG: (Fe-S)-binding protein [Planctomycetota bacterium]